MVFNSIANPSIPQASNAKDLAKKKRANRSAKLKQCKLDARRQQWLSQVKNKGCKGESNGSGEIHVPPMYAPNERERAIGSLEISPRNRETDGSIHNFSDSDSSSNSPTSHTGSIVGSGTNFTGSSSSSSSSSSSGRSYSGNLSEDEDEGCMDDWEAVADALTATDDKKEQHNHNSESPPEHENVTHSDSPPELVNRPVVLDISKPKCPVIVDISKPKLENSRAWRPDDAFRPQSLPNLIKQRSFPMKSDRHCGHGGTAWVSKNVISALASCPICCEDLDFTDSCFLPCSCGFRLCLFCHKRILEEDGRCPGCRKQYDYDADKAEGNANFSGGPTFRLARSFSMITRS